jgi:hypothetical protein
MLIKTFLLTLFTMQVSLAANFDQYRSQLPSLKKTSLQKAHQESAKRTQLIRQNLSIPSYLLPKTLTHPLLQGGDKPRYRFSYSNYFKMILEKISDRIRSEEVLAPPMAINPAWSAAQARELLKSQELKKCTQTILGPQRTISESEMTDYDRLLSQMLDRAKSSKAKVVENQALDKNQSTKYFSSLSDYVDKGPGNQRAGSITDILGSVRGIESFDGIVREIQFSKEESNLTDLNTTSMTLEMLLGFRLKKDESFVAAQKCLLDFMKEQLDVLNLRWHEIQKTKLGVQLQTSLNTRAQFIEEISDKVRAVPAASFDFSKKMEKLASTNRVEFYARNLRTYQEYRQFSSLASETRFIEQRTRQIKMVRNFLTLKYQGALRASEMLSKLSTEQIDFMIDVFLQLGGFDFPSEEEFAKAQIDFIKALEKRNDIEILADYEFYRNINSLMIELSFHLKAQKMSEEARKQDLRKIFDQQKP